jgi:hypothetical protein
MLATETTADATLALVTRFENGFNNGKIAEKLTYGTL